MNEAVSVFEQLSLFEVIQMSYLQREGMYQNVSIFLTMLSGFLVLTYLVGEKLDRLEAVLVSLLYSAVSVFLVFDYAQLAYRNLLTAAYVAKNEPNIAVFFLIPVLMLLGWLVSIGYIVRKRRAGDLT